MEGRRKVLTGGNPSQEEGRSVFLFTNQTGATRNQHFFLVSPFLL